VSRPAPGSRASRRWEDFRLRGTNTVQYLGHTIAWGSCELDNHLVTSCPVRGSPSWDDFPDEESSAKAFL
jgi:hypothetical protein